MLLGLLSVVLCAAPTTGFQPGRYEGSVLNTTANVRGKARFEITAIDSAGHVSAHFVASDGLVGESLLQGTIDEEGVMRLSGDLMRWRMIVDARRAGDGIAALYTLLGTPMQHGQFEVQYQGPLAPAPALVASARLADLAGTWRKADAFTPPLNPVTHLPTGDRFEDGGTFSIDPSGRFQLSHLHNHCDGFGAHCCRMDVLETRGTLSLEGDALVFAVASGKQLHQDSCMPRMNGQLEVKAHTERHRWALRRNGGGTPALCWMSGSDWTCFSKR